MKNKPSYKIIMSKFYIVKKLSSHKFFFLAYFVFVLQENASFRRPGLHDEQLEEGRYPPRKRNPVHKNPPTEETRNPGIVETRYPLETRYPVPDEERNLRAEEARNPRTVGRSRQQQRER